MSVNKENVKKWIKALRSGRYRQTVGALNDSNGYCCLGVACETAIQNGLKVEKENSDAPAENIIRYDGQSGALPASVRDWLGVVGRDPYLDYEGDEVAASALNDDLSLTFAEIADLVEKELILEEGE